MLHQTITDIHKALHEESIQNDVSGWIFTNFHNRDSFTNELLSLSGDSVSTRRWIYIILTDGREIKILHAIEPHSLDSLPASETYSYSSQAELKDLLSTLKNTYGNTFCILADENISVISTVDGGFISLLSSCGIKTVSAAPIIQRTKGILTPDQIESQERAGTVLYQAVYDAWELISSCYHTDTPITEYEVQQFIMKQFDNAGLITDHPPIVAFGAHAGDPHYEPSETQSARAREGDVIQLDIWAKEKGAGAVYADISWVGYYGSSIPEPVQKCWETLTSARDSVFLKLSGKDLSASAESGKSGEVTGASLDEGVRSIITEAGYAHGLKHRTGHGIDTKCHGSGVNLDSVEFPDSRLILEGSSFSVEPGLYFDSFGLRTEIDIYIQNGRPVISGRKRITCPLEIPQKNILTIL